MSIWEAKAAMKELDRLKKEAREERRYDDGNNYTHLKRKVQDKLKDLLRMDEERAEAKTEQRDKESILPQTPIDDNDFFDKWSNKININKYALKVFLLDRKHIP
jgi:AAA15 family ATPase/GTPase